MTNEQISLLFLILVGIALQERKIIANTSRPNYTASSNFPGVKKK